MRLKLHSFQSPRSHSFVPTALGNKMDVKPTERKGLSGVLLLFVCLHRMTQIRMGVSGRGTLGPAGGICKPLVSPFQGWEHQKQPVLLGKSLLGGVPVFGVLGALNQVGSGWENPWCRQQLYDTRWRVDNNHIRGMSLYILLPSNTGKRK